MGDIVKKFGKKSGVFIKEKSRLVSSILQKISKKQIMIFILIVLALTAAIFIKSIIEKSMIQRQIPKYWSVQPKLEDAAIMNFDDIKSEFLDPFSSILKVNNGLKVAKILSKSDSRYNDSIKILKEISKYAEDEAIFDVIQMSILSIQIMYNTEKRDVNPVQKIARSKSPYHLLAIEVLAENELSLGNEKLYYKNIDKIYHSKNLKSPHMKDRIEELYYIATPHLEN